MQLCRGTAAARLPDPSPWRGALAGFVSGWCGSPGGVEELAPSSPPPFTCRAAGTPAGTVLTASAGAGLRPGCRGSAGPPRRSRAPCGPWLSGKGLGSPRGTAPSAGRSLLFLVPGERSPRLPAAPPPGSAPRCLWPPPPPRPRPRAAPSRPRCPARLRPRFFVCGSPPAPGGVHRGKGPAPHLRPPPAPGASGPGPGGLPVPAPRLPPAALFSLRGASAASAPPCGRAQAGGERGGGEGGHLPQLLFLLQPLLPAEPPLTGP